MQIDLVEIWQLHSFIFDLLIFPQIQIPTKELIEDIIQNLLSVVHLFIGLYSYSP